jgi:hypothetical protein
LSGRCRRAPPGAQRLPRRSPAELPRASYPGVSDPSPPFSGSQLGLDTHPAAPGGVTRRAPSHGPTVPAPGRTCGSRTHTPETWRCAGTRCPGRLAAAYLCRAARPRARHDPAALPIPINEAFGRRLTTDQRTINTLRAVTRARAEPGNSLLKTLQGFAPRKEAKAQFRVDLRGSPPASSAKLRCPFCDSDLQVERSPPPQVERPSGSSANQTTALSAAPQPAHGDIRLGQGLGWQLCLIGPGAHRMKRKVGDRDREIEILRYAVVGLA